MNAFDLFGMIDMVATVFKEIANLSSSKLLLDKEALCSGLKLIFSCN